MQTSEMTVGAYSDYSCNISQEARDVFTTALAVLTGVSYTPFAVATQLVSGTNYSFLCNSKTVYPGATNQVAIVNIYQPLEGDPHITEIRRFEPYAVSVA